MTRQRALSARDLRVCHRSKSGSFELEVEALDLGVREVLAVLGPNGAGKSTLLRTLAGLEPPGSGRIERHARGPVTMVFQRPIALSGSVAHNLAAALWGRGLSRAESRSRVAEGLERFGIAPLAGRRAATLSGGELRRLALARAFALRPAVLLLDEPFDDLDAAGQESLSLDLRRAIADTAVAVAVVTHDLRRALLLSDRIAVLMEGRVVQLDAPAEVLARPVSPAVARLVGMKNLLPGHVASERRGELGFVELGPDLRVPAIALPDPGTPVWVGIRPEHLKLDVGRGEGDPIGKGVVRTLVSDGVAANVGVEWGGFDLVTHLLAGRGLARNLTVGDSVSLTLRPEDVHWMQRDS